MSNETKKSAAMMAVFTVFAVLAAAFAMNPGWRRTGPGPIPLVDTNFLDTNTVRKSYADLALKGEDLSDFDCNTCHEKGKPPPIHLDTNGVIIVAKEHADIVMGHGTHGRNNNCYNCHDETNLTLLQARDGRKITFSESQLLCGSCHGPTLRDWDAGAHGRTGGFWDRALGGIDRKLCVNCHNPHSPKFPGRAPAPGPHLLHPPAAVPHLEVASEPAATPSTHDGSKSAGTGAAPETAAKQAAQPEH